MAATDDQGNVVLLDHGTVEQASGVDVSGDEPGVPDHQDTRDTVAPHSIRRSSVTTPPTIRQSWDIAGGEIVFELRSEHALPAATFGDIGKIITGIEALADSLGKRDDSDTADEGGET